MTGIIAAAQYSIAATVPITVQLHNQSISKVSLSTSTVSYTINSNGNVVGNPGGTLEAWITGTGYNTANYECMATQTSGNAISGTLNSWLNCGSSNTWSLTNAAQNNSVLTGVFTVQIRDTATHTVQASASITISAESDSAGGRL